MAVLPSVCFDPAADIYGKGTESPDRLRDILRIADVDFLSPDTTLDMIRCDTKPVLSDDPLEGGLFTIPE